MTLHEVMLVLPLNKQLEILERSSRFPENVVSYLNELSKVPTTSYADIESWRSNNLEKISRSFPLDGSGRTIDHSFLTINVNRMADDARKNCQWSTDNAADPIIAALWGDDAQYWSY